MPDDGERLLAVRRLAHDLEVRDAREHAPEPVADHRVVVDDDQPDRAHDAEPADAPAAIAGTRAETAVPPPGSDSIASEPATRVTRWRIAVSPNPDPGAAVAWSPPRSPTVNPTPSSRTSSVTTSPMNDRVSQRVRRVRVAADVRERLLGRPEQRDLDLRVEGDDLARHRDLALDPVEGGPVAGDLGEGVGQGPRLERGRHRRLHRAARLDQAVAGELLGVVEMAVAVRRPVAGVVGRLELGHDPDQALGDGVVDLAGHPGPLVEDARLAGLREELGVEAGVLVEGGLELRERPAALLVLLGGPLPVVVAPADHDGLDADEHEVERPALGRLREARRSAC